MRRSGSDLRLKIAILESGRRQQEIARSVGIHPSTLSGIVRGRIRANAAERKRLAKYLQRPVEELFPLDAIEPLEARTA